MTTMNNIYLNRTLRLQIKNMPQRKPLTYRVIAYSAIAGSLDSFKVSCTEEVSRGSSREFTMTLTRKGENFSNEHGCEFVIADDKRAAVGALKDQLSKSAKVPAIRALLIGALLLIASAMILTATLHHARTQRKVQGCGIIHFGPDVVDLTPPEQNRCDEKTTTK